MPSVQLAGGNPQYLPRSGLETLVSTLVEQGYTVIGPRVMDGVISMQPLTSVDDLAHGVLDEQEKGRYRLGKGDPELCFQFVVGPDGPKRYFFPPSQRLFRIRTETDGFAIEDHSPPPPAMAFLGIRPCELAALAIQDRVFGAREMGTFRCEADSYYQEARKTALTVVVNCSHPGKNCFCTSTGTGPVASEGYDLALTELRGGFIVQSGSPRGEEIVQKLPVRECSSAELELAELRLQLAAARLEKHLDAEGLSEQLEAAVEHPHWDDVAKRCLGCGNCTQVCPTCFCSTVTDSSDLTGKLITRTRNWESCFTHQFSYTTAGPVRHTIRSRYRHWLRHKLATFKDQFGTNGCVGCGRCITWCPAGIDITEEAAAVRRDSAPAAVAASD